jgi:D-apionolactonase
MPSIEEIEVGPVRVVLAGLDLRYLEVGGIEVVRRAFVTLRDADWATVEPDAPSLDVTESDGVVEITGTAPARRGDIEATCRVRIRVSADAAEYAVAWDPGSEFAYNRMGLCILHPPERCAGRGYRAAERSGRLPETIGPQRLVDGNPQPLFEPFEALEIDVAGLGPCGFLFTGDLFEMEDQRNWSDGSFKTYCTPLSRPRPHTAEPGRPVEQAVRVEWPRASRTPRRDVVELHCDGTPEGEIPRLGAGFREGAPAAVGRLGLHHLRVDLRRADTAAAELAAAAAFAGEIGAELFVAVHTPLPDGVLAEHADAISYVLAFAGEPPAGFRVAGGTDDWFVELNRARPDVARLDGIAWSVTPQVHGSDELTMVEGLAAQTDQLTSARAFADGRALLVGPVTLRPRSEEPDPRQGSAFAAAWTAASIAAQAAGGAWSVTYYETHGPGGVVGFPVFDVLADACRWQGRPRLRTTSSAPLAAQALVVEGGEGWLLNLRGADTRVRFDGETTVLEPWEVRRVG